MTIYQKIKLFLELWLKPVYYNGKLVRFDCLTAWQWANTADFVLE